jgi:DNA/RNA-binding domain of Phe-tRNA-synthetase-like protein
MDKQARRKYFERLYTLRETYRELGPDDTRSVISIEAMLQRADRLMEQPSSPLIATFEERDLSN